MMYSLSRKMNIFPMKVLHKKIEVSNRPSKVDIFQVKKNNQEHRTLMYIVFL